MEAFGDLARSLVLRSNQARLRQQLDTLGIEVATGVVRDSPKHLGGDTTLLNALDRSLARLETFRVNTAEAQLVATTMQTALGSIQDSTEKLAQSLLSADLTPSENLLNTLSGEAAQTLGKVLGSLNTSVAGRFVFAGVQTDQPAVVGFEAMKSALQTELAGASDLATIEAAVDTFSALAGRLRQRFTKARTQGLRLCN
jgi:flagellar hook-associated protein 3 FlgL